MYCPQCGTPNDDSSRYCMACGAALGSPAEVTSAPVDRLASPTTDQRQVPAPLPPLVSPHAATAGERHPTPATEEVFEYRAIDWQFAALIPLVFLIAAGWVAFVYLALPQFWEWSTDGLIPYSASKMASYDQYLAWGFPAVWLLLYFVGLPLARVFGVREVGLSERGITFRDRSGHEKAVISRLAAVDSKQRMTRLRGWTPQGKKIRRVVPRDRLGKEEYKEFQEKLGRLLPRRQEPSVR